MGRKHYLTRLALGRSIYEDQDAEIPFHLTNDDSSLGHYVQQFDSKGNPINPEVEAFDKSMIAAHNDVLALVGVVERKDRTDRLSELHRSAVREHRQILLSKEQDAADIIDYLLIPTRFFSHLYLDALLARLVVNLYHPSLSFFSILLTDVRSILAAPTLRLAVATAFPALGNIVSFILLRLPLQLAAEQIAGRAQTLLSASRFSRKASRRLHHAISALFEAAVLAIDVLLLPIDYHTLTQRLYLTPALPIFPAWSFVWPLSRTSFHTFAWKPLFTSSILLRAISPPAMILLANRLIYPDLYSDDATTEERLPLTSYLTSFRNPTITADPSLVTRPAFVNDPLGWISYHSWSVRRRILHWTGFRAKHFQPQPASLRRRATEDLEGRQTREVAVSSPSSSSGSNSQALSLLLPVHLDISLSALSSRLLSLPINAILLRGVAESFFQRFGSADGATGPALVLATAPFTTFSSRRLATFVSRIGLTLALHVVVDVGIFAGLKWIVDQNTSAEFDAPAPPPGKALVETEDLATSSRDNNSARPADIWQEWRASRGQMTSIHFEDGGDEVTQGHLELAPVSRSWQEWTTQLRENGRGDLSGPMNWWRMMALDRGAPGDPRRFGHAIVANRNEEGYVSAWVD